MEDIIKVPSYIYGEERFASPESRRIIYDTQGKQALEIHDTNDWGINAAIDNATVTQQKLKNISVSSISNLIKTAMVYYLDEDSKYHKIISITGSPIQFIKEGSEFVKEWGRNLHPYIEAVLGDFNHSQIRNDQTAPILAILPGNSDQEVLFVLIQTLLSRNSVVVRPSSNGAGSYCVIEFIRAINKAIDAAQDIYLEPLRSAIALINTSSNDYLEKLCCDDWNYIAFGSESTIKLINKRIRAQCTPRKVLGYGTGLSTTVVIRKNDLPKTAQQIISSVVENRGNECVDTDIIYIHDQIYEDLLNLFIKEIEKILSGDPFDPDTIGVLEPSNVSYCIGEVTKRGKGQYLRIAESDEHTVIHPSLIPINKYETSLEYPGPIASIRSFGGINELSYLIKKDLSDNNMSRNLVTSVFTDSDDEFDNILPILRAYCVKRNKPTHQFNFALPHQGVFLLKELVHQVYLDK